MTSPMPPHPQHTWRNNLRGFDFSALQNLRRHRLAIALPLGWAPSWAAAGHLAAAHHRVCHRAVWAHIPGRISETHRADDVVFTRARPPLHPKAEQPRPRPPGDRLHPWVDRSPACSRSSTASFSRLCRLQSAQMSLLAVDLGLMSGKRTISDRAVQIGSPSFGQAQPTAGG